MKRLLLGVLLLLPLLGTTQIRGEVKIGRDFKNTQNYFTTVIKYDYKPFKDIKIIPYTKQKVWFKEENAVTYHPMRHVYKLGIKIEYKNIFINGFHYCSHLISNGYNISYDKLGSESVFGTEYYKWIDDMLVGSSTCIEIGFKF